MTEPVPALHLTGVLASTADLSPANGQAAARVQTPAAELSSPVEDSLTIDWATAKGQTLTPGRHFRLHYYGAVLRLLVYIARLPGPGVPDEAFRRFPFLNGYAQEIAGFLPPGLPSLQAIEWWETTLGTWERGEARGAGGTREPVREPLPALTTPHLPLRTLEQLDGVGKLGRTLFILAGLGEEDSRFGTLFRYLQEPLPARRLTVETAGRILAAGEQSGNLPAWELAAGLFAVGALEAANPEAPRAEWMLRVPTPVWDAARGDMAHGDPANQKEAEKKSVRNGETGRPAEVGKSEIRIVPSQEFPDLEALILPEDFLERLKQVPGLLAEGRARALVLRSGLGSIRRQVAGSVARALGCGVVEVAPPPPVMVRPGEDDSALLIGRSGPPLYPPWLGVLCALSNTVPVFTFDLAPGETVPLPDLPGCPAPTVALLGAEGGVSGARVNGSLALSLPFPGPELRLRHWQSALGIEEYGKSRKDAPSDTLPAELKAAPPADELQAIASRFLLPGGYIRQAAALAAAESALDKREAIRLEDVRRAARTLNRQALDNLAEPLFPLPASSSAQPWGLLVAGITVLGKLHELSQRCRYRERLLERLSPAFRASANRGVRALFTGASGTGKTLAARILAAELGMDLYRIDLAAVVNKYIGETEKNLNRVLSRAEELDVILLLDEGDSLLGGRTDVRSANDRYANLETNYLLQRLEHYQGILLVTSNAAQNIDSAFQRRMDVVVHFVPPQADERLAIWSLHLPQDHAVDPGSLRKVAERCDLTGGQIRNAALLATLLAEAEGTRSPLRDAHLEAAVRAEYRKAGGIPPEILGYGESSSGETGIPEITRETLQDGPVQAFTALLGASRPR